MYLGVDSLAVMFYPYFSSNNCQGKATNLVSRNHSATELFQLSLRMLFSVVCLYMFYVRIHVHICKETHTHTHTCLGTPTRLPMSGCRSDKNVAFDVETPRELTCFTDMPIYSLYLIPNAKSLSKSKSFITFGRESTRGEN